jgi:hypothetical protein
LTLQIEDESPLLSREDYDIIRLNKLINDYRQGDIHCSRQIEKLVKSLKQISPSASKNKKFADKYLSPYKAI